VPAASRVAALSTSSFRLVVTRRSYDVFGRDDSSPGLARHGRHVERHPAFRNLEGPTGAASNGPRSTCHDDRMTAELHVLSAGYAAERVASTVVLVIDQGQSVVVDPGMVSHRGKILDPLAGLGVDPADVRDVVFSHHHPDHTLNAALFARARFHDFWAIYQDDTWTDRPADGFQLSPSVRLMATPGHTAQDITTLVETAEGLVACTHLWWSKNGPAEDPLAEDPAALHRSRAALLELGPALIVPGHGDPFRPDELQRA
jgi:glyoxylase-like metal-dependent hydrolase (beta-lactamase superfamily II)